LCKIERRSIGTASLVRAGIVVLSLIEEMPERGTNMSRTIAIELVLPDDLKRFRLPKGVNARLQELLDQQDGGEPLSKAQREEAEGLADMVDMLALLRLRAQRASRTKRRKP
jgi:hypothetical protein